MKNEIEDFIMRDIETSSVRRGRILPSRTRYVCLFKRKRSRMGNFKLIFL